MSKKVLLIGGGTGGHIMPLIPLTQQLKKQGARVKLIFSENELDAKLAAGHFTQDDVVFFRTGKIRRYLSWKNVPDFFRILGSFFRAKRILRQFQPDVIFMKGGFVCFPFLIAAKWLLRYKGKIYLHESDSTKSIMNTRFKGYFDRIFYSFGEHVEGTPLFTSPEAPLLPKSLQNRDKNRPLLFVFGGSQGAVFVNTLICKNIDFVSRKYDVVIISGKGKMSGLERDDFWEFELLESSEFHGVLNEADVVVSRAGANSLMEIVNAKKPSLIIPLPSSSRDHQRDNARYFATRDLCLYKEQTALFGLSGEELVMLLDMIVEDEDMKGALAAADYGSREVMLSSIILGEKPSK